MRTTKYSFATARTTAGSVRTLRNKKEIHLQSRYTLGSLRIVPLGPKRDLFARQNYNTVAGTLCNKESFVCRSGIKQLAM